MEWNGHCYIAIKNRLEILSKSWAEAEVDCVARASMQAGVKGHLVSIGSVAENAIVKSISNILNQKHNFNLPVRIGLNDIAVDGTFVFTNGDTLLASLPLWENGRPKNRSDEDCVRQNSNTGLWDDNHCNTDTLKDMWDYVCELEAVEAN